VGLTLLDAGVVIGLLDDTDPHHHAAHTAIAERRHRQRFAIPASVFAETLVGPHRRGVDAARVVHRLVERLPIEIVPLDWTIADGAARIRARHRSIKLPDALVIATADPAGASEVLTTDRGWPDRDAFGITAELVVV
jgi:predicted nucleic acid-binding protein